MTLTSPGMAPLLPRLATRTATKATKPWTCLDCRVLALHRPPLPPGRTFTTTPSHPVQLQQDPGKTQNLHDNSYNQPATNLSHNVSEAETDHFRRVEAASKSKQHRAPWMREGSDAPPVSSHAVRSAGAMTKGKLLTTPSRMLKLILPLTTRDVNKERKDVEPLALLVHPQQPLSYLERLIQSELPSLLGEKGERAPGVTFRAQDREEESLGGGRPGGRERRL